MDNKLYTTQELMEIFRVSRYTIYRAKRSGALPIARKNGRENLYSEAAVLRYMETSGNRKLVAE